MQEPIPGHIQRHSRASLPLARAAGRGRVVPPTGRGRAGAVRRTGAGVPYRLWLLAIILLLLPVSCLGAASVTQIFLQHTLTVLLLGALIVTGVRHPLDNMSYTLLFLYLLLHLIGAHYLYSRVPYDDWSQSLIGIRISEALGWQRNHYDRFVHLCFGLLMVHPVRVVTERLMNVRGGWSYFIAVLLIISFSAVYEHMEWLVSIVFAPETADSYNGQQGDMWDAQKDSALATIGAIFSASLEAIIVRRRMAGRRKLKTEG
jgi:putative membrane protein